MNNAVQYTISVILSACVVILFSSIFIDFFLYNNKSNTKHEKHSRVATGSMIAFYIIYYILMRFNIGKWLRAPDVFFKIQLILGTVMIISGTIINITGRMQLKENWANHIKIYENHTLVTRGGYSYVRHPLYASIILMLYGGCIVYSNWLNVILVSIVFIPAMGYRAKQEEQLLLNEFLEYKDYREQVGMFFPKKLRRYKREHV